MGKFGASEGPRGPPAIGRSLPFAPLPGPPRSAGENAILRAPLPTPAVLKIHTRPFPPNDIVPPPRESSMTLVSAARVTTASNDVNIAALRPRGEWTSASWPSAARVAPLSSPIKRFFPGGGGECLNPDILSHFRPRFDRSIPTARRSLPTEISPRRGNATGIPLSLSRPCPARDGDPRDPVTSRRSPRDTWHALRILFGRVLIRHARPLSVHTSTMLDTEPTENPIRLSGLISQIMSYGTVLIRVLK